MSVPRACLSLTLVHLAGACAAPPPPLAVERAVLTRPTASVPAALYFTVRNTGAQPVAVSEVQVHGAFSTSLLTPTAHRAPAIGTAPSSTPLYEAIDSVGVPAGASVRFAPGGYFVSVGKLRRPLARGDTVQLSLRITTGAVLPATARVLDYADLDTALVANAAGVAHVATAASVAGGRALYRENGCGSCHGPEGHGDGPVAATLAPPPRDFRRAGDFRTEGDEATITQLLATGIPNGGQMPLYAHLSTTERRSLALYVLSLRQPLPPRESSP
ncbi:MAG: copper chaperone PCu(A)C [Gemmatimonadaceae bacterium]|nr:copper chaperone PCu(A)C [Gemmatimonadaceae bacterium]